MVAHEMEAGRGHEGGKPGHQVEGLEDDVAGAVAPAVPEAVKEPGKGWYGMDIADSYLQGGDKLNAIRWLEKAFEEPDPNLPHGACSPQWDALRSEPGFQNLLRRMNLPQ